MKKSTVKSIAFAAAALLTVMPFCSFAEVKALSFAINEGNGSGDRQPIKDFMSTNDVDFAAFDFTKASGANYFIGADGFSQNGKNFAAKYYGKKNVNSHQKCFFYNSDKYKLLNDPNEDQSGDNMAAVFEDEYGDQFALISLRGDYVASKVKSYIDGIAEKYLTAKLIVTYNARVGETDATQSETLNASLTTEESGPQMACLGSTEAEGKPIGGVYMYPNDVPSSYSVSLVPKSIGTRYAGTLATLEFPNKYRVIFVDWDGTGLQTNIVAHGGSVTPPTPVRDGYTFIGWDHPTSDFESVTASFVATAQYDVPTLFVSGDPEALGTADPAYGTITTISVGDTFTASVTLPDPDEGATERWVCAGYTHYRITDLAAGIKAVEQHGDTSSFSYTHVWIDELVWHFTNEWFVAVSATAGGSVSAGNEWVRNAEALPLVATPEEGYVFWRWIGDTDGIADVTALSVAPTVTAARSLKAVFVPIGGDPAVQYVATTGSDENSGYFLKAPKLTIQAAVDTLAAAPGYGTVHVAKGRYETRANPGVAITNAIAVLGDSGNPEDVIVRNETTGGMNNAIVLRLNHPDAFVANLVVENGYRYAQSNPYGANVAIDSAGGAVSNCVIRNGTSVHFYPRGIGAWLNSPAALLTHCVVTNNTFSGVGKQAMNVYAGLAVHVEKGTVANCLIANNTNPNATGPVTDLREAATCGVAVMDGRILNCTVVTNEARYTGGIYLGSKGYATNVVVAGCVNHSTYVEESQNNFTDTGFKGALANASHCASDGGEALTDNCVAGTAAEFFADFNGGDYRLSKNSPLRNKGLEYDDIAEFDLVGKKRVQGSKPDIGCFESAPSGLSVIIR